MMIEESQQDAINLTAEFYDTRWRHFKGRFYIVRLICLNSEDGTLQVVYKEENGPNTWVRPWAMWNEIVFSSAYIGPRFVRVDL